MIDKLLRFLSSPLISNVKMEPPPFGKYFCIISAAPDLRKRMDDLLFQPVAVSLKNSTTFNAFST